VSILLDGCKSKSVVHRRGKGKDNKIMCVVVRATAVPQHTESGFSTWKSCIVAVIGKVSEMFCVSDFSARSVRSPRCEALKGYQYALA
jgi:hypothetical protein